MSLSTVTRASLGARALQRANLEYSNFITATELNGLVDVSMAKLYNLLVGLYQDYFVKTATLTLSAGNAFNLPADFFKTRQCFMVDTGGRRRTIPWMELSETANLSYAGTTVNCAEGYNIIDNTIRVYPENGTYTDSLILYYVPEYTPPASDTAQIKFAIAFGWDEWVVNDVAVQIGVKAKMPIEETVRERALIEQKLKHEASIRQAGTPRRVANTGFSRRWR